tara:strand:- start:382 stop:642 length:261 start_codon:yes stop_codon:yes gene_type:complete
MPNRNYEKGRRKEYKIVNILKNLNYNIVQRTAGSHSPVDIIAIKEETKEILLIQAKPNNFRKTQEAIIMKKHSGLNGDFKVKFEVR